jgi:hypothetical protein
MNKLDEMVLEARRAEAVRERDLQALRNRATRDAPSGRRWPRAWLGGCLVRTGLWLDPRASQVLDPTAAREAGQRA